MWTDKYIKSFDKKKIHYKFHKGNSPTLAFIHGGGINSLCWEHQYNYFKEKGNSVLTLDLRGHGKSKGHSRGTNFQNIIKDINLILEKEKIKNVTLIGHSMGGMVSLAFHHKHPEKVKAIIIIASIPHITISVTEKAKRFLKFCRRIRNAKKKHENYLRNGDRRHEYKMFHTSPYSLFQNYLTLRKFNGEPLLRGVKVPTLVIAAKDDEFFPPELVKEAAKKIKNSTFKVIPGRHLFIITQKDKVNKEIESFIRNI
tara:strand:+ start:606 stop:1373 length:768 start_codon:yes stop_codon:yes gene_type:complete